MKFPKKSFLIKTTYDISLDSQISFSPLGFSLIYIWNLFSFYKIIIYISKKQELLDEEYLQIYFYKKREEI